MTHAVLPSMAKRKTGILITTSSLAGSLDVPLMSAYSCAKAALIKLQQSLVAEVEKDGILCFSVQPGTVPTEIGTTEHVFNPAAVEWPLAQQMFKDFETVKLQSPQLFANSCVAICADERFKVLNGKFIDVEQPLDEVLKEAEKPDGGRIAKEDMYHLKLDEL
jgi:short-subunit dehydrogenase